MPDGTKSKSNLRCPLDQIYLRQQGYFTTQHEKFSTSLYTLPSDESVHLLTAEREYGRLMRNVVIEYGVMFLTVLDVKI